MIEITGDIWREKCNWLCITTNSVVKANGRAVMGKGIALQAKYRCPDIDLILAEKLKQRGNIPVPLCRWNDRWIISFPTKNDWESPSDIQLIERSAKELKLHFDKHGCKPIVLLPRPGCGNGGLDWKDVKKILEPILVDPEFHIITIDRSSPRILICGDRNWSNKGQIMGFLASVPRNSIIIEGECRGADKMACEAAGVLGMKVLDFPADWSKFGAKAGPIRNEQQLNEGQPSHVVAYHSDISSSKGTKNMITQAKKAGVPTYLNAENWKEIEKWKIE